MSVLHRAVVAAAAVALVPSVVSAAGAPANADEPTYYVSLGDSLASGWQPDSRQDEPDVAYTNRIYEALKADDPNLVHVALGCAGETSATLIAGGICDSRYAADPRFGGATNQLDAATHFLEEHRDQIRYVTVDIGANDVNRCLGADLNPDLTCFANGITAVGGNSSTIYAALHAAAGDDPSYAAMTYYNPFLALWLQGTDAARGLVTLSVNLQQTLNGTISSAATSHGFAVADVAPVFESADLQTMVTWQGQEIPRAVERICVWTWMCSMQDIHANTEGHQVLADAFLAVLDGGGSGEPGDGAEQLEVTVPEGSSGGPGEFVWNIDGSNGLVDLGTATDSGDHFAASGELNPVRVSDTRADAPAWTLSAQVGDFVSGATSFSGAMLGWTPEVSENTGGAEAGAPVESGFFGNDGGDGLAVSSVLGAAAQGHPLGSALLGAELDLRIPSEQAEGTYRATLTLTALG